MLVSIRADHNAAAIMLPVHHFVTGMCLWLFKTSGRDILRCSHVVCGEMMLEEEDDEEENLCSFHVGHCEQV